MAGTCDQREHHHRGFISGQDTDEMEINFIDGHADVILARIDTILLVFTNV